MIPNVLANRVIRKQMTMEQVPEVYRKDVESIISGDVEEPKVHEPKRYSLEQIVRNKQNIDGMLGVEDDEA